MAGGGGRVEDLFGRVSRKQSPILRNHPLRVDVDLQLGCHPLGEIVPAEASRLLARNERPLLPGTETRPAASAQAGIGDDLDDLLRLHFQRFPQRRDASSL